MEILFATKNKGKLVEIKKILDKTVIVPLGMEEFGIDIDVIEDGTTFEENAIKKAKTLCEYTGKVVLADDSGLEIDYLDKKPGVYSARFLGEDTPPATKNKTILDTMKDVPKEKRTARFITVIATYFPDGKVITTKGVTEGFIHTKTEGCNGFGYDPIFYVEEFKKTYAELTIDEKNKISQRAKALTLMKEKLLGELNL